MVSNGKPTMIVPGVDRKKKATTERTVNSGKASKRKTVYSQYYSDSESDADVEEVRDTDSNEDEKTEAERFLREVWESISPPVKECDVIGKWFCAVI